MAQCIFKRLIFLSLFSCIGVGYAEERSLTIEIKESILKKIEELKKNDSDGVYQGIEDLSNVTNKYISERQKECSGEMSIITRVQDPNKSPVVKNLTIQEKKSCLLELLEFRKHYVNEIFDLRKKSAKQEFDKRMQRLDQQKKNLLDEIDKISSKIK